MSNVNGIGGQVMLVMIIAFFEILSGIVGIFAPGLWIRATSFDKFGKLDLDAEGEMEYLATLTASLQLAVGVLLGVAAFKRETTVALQVVILLSVVILGNELMDFVARRAGWRTEVLELQGGVRLDLVYAVVGLILSIAGLFCLKKPRPTAIIEARQHLRAEGEEMDA